MVSKKSHESISQPALSGRVKRGVICKIFHFLFGEVEDFGTINQIKQNIHILKEN